MTTTVATPRRLPHARGLHRQQSQRRWWIAVTIAIAINLAVVVGLSQVSQLHAPALTPPLAVHTLRQLDQPPPPPPETPREIPDTPSDEVMTLALPTLDLPAIAPTAALTLPAIGSLDPQLDLPLSVPAFAVAAPEPALATTGGTGLPAFDTPAERISSLDLSRYYPRSARLRGVTGSTVVRITIDAQGRVTDATVLSSSPAGVFDEAAKRVARECRYRPATAAGVPVASVQDTPISWVINE
jgi:periplasmic protein TonB